MNGNDQIKREVEGNDSTIVAYKEKGRVHYVKHEKGYGFIRPDNKNFDDIFFHFSDIEPWRDGYKEVRGYCREPYFAGESVVFNIVRTNKDITGVKGKPKDSYAAKQIEIVKV